MADARTAMLIAGPTASGKSAYAAARAAQSGGVVVNADSMQVYDVLNVLSARPPRDEQLGMPHLLYGEVHPSVRFSTGAWVSRATEILENLPAAQEVIFVGGTGLYFQALINGFTDVPAIPDEIVREIDDEVCALDRAGRAALLAQIDPEMAARLVEPDRQRVVRALSVLRHTGRSLAAWQDDETVPVLKDVAIERVILNPDREVLNDRIAKRFAGMMDNGAVEEVQALLALELDPSLPAMKAIGVPEITRWLADELSREEAIELATIATRQYAKRQRTWFRNQFADWPNFSQAPEIN